MSKIYQPTIMNGVNGNVFYVPANANIQDYIFSASPWDTLILAAGTYTLSSVITINKPLTIIGQGDSTYIYRASGPCFSGMSSFITLKNIKVYGVAYLGGVIEFYGWQGSASDVPKVISDCNLYGVTVEGSQFYGDGRGGLVWYCNAGGNVVNCSISSYISSSPPTPESANGLTATMLYLSGGLDRTLNIYDTDISVAGSSVRSKAGVDVNNFGSCDNYITVNIYNSNIVSSGPVGYRSYGVVSKNAKSKVYIYGGYISGENYDVTQSLSAVLDLCGVNLSHNTTSGSITYSGTISSNDYSMQSGYRYRSVTNNITASTVQTQGSRALTSEVNRISACANNNDTVTLPSAVSGMEIMVINNGAKTLQIFPASSDEIDSLGVNTSTTLATGKSKRFISWSDANWVMKEVN